MNSSCSASLSKDTRNLNRCSDCIRSIGFEKDHEFNERWLREVRRVLKPEGTLWVSGTHHVIFSLGSPLEPRIRVRE